MISTSRDSTPTRSATPSGTVARLRHWLALPVILAGVSMVTLDFFIVNVAIPSLQRGLHANAAAIQFVIAGYGLAVAAGLITGGRLGDLYGQRRLFALGLALFTLTSAACGLAPTPALLVLARVAQGLAAALILPQALALLGSVYSGEERARAFTAYGVALGLAAIGGQLIGGVLIQADVAGLGWRACFLVNVPLGAAALLLTPRLIPASRAEGRGRLDLAGAVLVTLGLVAVVLPLIEGREQGWPLWTWLCLAAAAPLLLAFDRYQRRLGVRGGQPLIDPALYGERAFTVGLLITVVFFAGMASSFLVLALYLQQGRGLDPLAAGEIFTVLAVGYCATSLGTGRLTQRLGRQALTVGALGMAAGLVLLRETVAHVGVGGPSALLAPALLLDGAGMGLVIAPLTATVLAGLAPRHAGAAAGVLTTMQQVGGALGVALIGLIFYGALGHATPRDAYPRAFGASLLYLIVLALVVAVLIQLLPRDRNRGAGASAGATR